MPTITTDTGTHIVPACPPWCVLTAGHDLVDPTHRDYDGAIVREHIGSRWMSGEAKVYVSAGETVGRPGDEGLDAPVIYVQADSEMSPEGARAMARALVAAADKLDEIEAAR